SDELSTPATCSQARYSNPYHCHALPRRSLREGGKEKRTARSKAYVMTYSLRQVSPTSINRTTHGESAATSVPVSETTGILRKAATYSHRAYRSIQPVAKAKAASSSSGFQWLH